MFAFEFPDYIAQLQRLISALASAGTAVTAQLSHDQRSTHRGFLTGSVTFENGSTLIFKEFVDLWLEEPKLMYAYHYQDAAGELIFRYDNAAHRPALPRPSHKHTSLGVAPADIPSLAQVLDEIVRDQHIT